MAIFFQIIFKNNSLFSNYLYSLPKSNLAFSGRLLSACCFPQLLHGAMRAELNFEKGEQKDL